MDRLNSGTRIATMLLDHVIMAFVCAIFVAPGMVYDLTEIFANPGAPPKLFLGNYYLNILGFSLYFNKDIYLGRSPAKRIFKFQVVDIRTNKPAGPLRCLVRNITIIFWPIEVVVGLINNERRIGDFLAGTRLTTYDPQQHQAQPRWAFVAIAIFASMLVTYLTMFYPIEVITRNSGFMPA